MIAHETERGASVAKGSQNHPECRHCSGTGWDAGVDTLPWTDWSTQPPEPGQLVVARWPDAEGNSTRNYCLGLVDEYGLVNGRVAGGLLQGVKQTEWLRLDTVAPSGKTSHWIE